MRPEQEKERNHLQMIEQTGTSNFFDLSTRYKE